ncbi:MAG: (Fe-S)-binding protein [Saprospiraceae bacterium]|nr:(Fe-S)-binding protein [Saprospiraceae bacterium]
MIQSLLFLIITGYAGLRAYQSYSAVYRNIHLGKNDVVLGDSSSRWRNVFLIALGQKKMFKNIIPAVLHLFIYTAFLLTQIELIEIFIDGIFGQHRFFSQPLGEFYTFIISLIEILSFLALIATIIFLIRRNILKVSRFEKPEMEGFPKLDANLILFGEILLITGIVCMNGADKVLQTLLPEHYHPTGNFAISSWLGTTLFENLSTGVLIAIERFGWWLHFLVVLAFINYLPFSKHFHIFLAFPNTYFAKLSPKGEISNMPEVMNEVKAMLGMPDAQPPSTELPVFGAKDIFDLSWRDILGAYSCTECGRCTAACPANLTGKKLSPRKIMMNVRDRAEEIGKVMDVSEDELTKENYDDGKSLFDYISKEEINACTTCNSCVEACPILINPLDIILQLRRYEILTESAGPKDWTPMFNSLENSGAVWQMPVERAAWASEA